MERHGKLRDAQLDAIKTYLYLKIACNNKPLWELMYDGCFNSLSDKDLDELQLKASSRKFIKDSPAARALYEYATSMDDKGISTSATLAALIADTPSALDYKKIIKALFYGIEYPDYLFSIPMGAGKTWLMAAFVYLNLYFALNEPNNKIFAHNFIVLAPAGLKSSIIPSLKDMQAFDPTFILPEPTASRIKAKLKYEILEDDNTAKNSNKVKNPNALKIQVHQPFETLDGLIVITNAEKLYDRINHKQNSAPSIPNLMSEKERVEWLKAEMANELRKIIAKIPNLCIMIDEVHHASEEQLLRQVVERWVAENTFNSVLGFSGTPYLSIPEKIVISESLTIKNAMLSNVVTYYPLVNAVGNFLKIPVIKSSDVSMEDIVRNGLEEFLSLYGNKVYPKVGYAKLVIYCGRIATLETQIFPLVVSICRHHGINPDEAVLKYYRTNKEGFSCPSDSEARFKSLDTELSKTRVVLLAQIGKEGWNCKSLTSVILPNENSSPRNMVLQTSCRCLREVVDSGKEHALIWLNKFNEQKLDEQLRKEHHSSVSEIQSPILNQKLIRRFSRQDIVQLPELSYIQLHFSYAVVSAGKENTEQRLKAIVPEKKTCAIIIEKKLDGSERIIGKSKNYDDLQAMEYNHWINLIAKESFFSISTVELGGYSQILKSLFDSVTILRPDNVRVLNPAIAQHKLRSDIRKCFTDRYDVKFSKEAIPKDASLLKVEKLSLPYFASSDRIIFPPEDEAQKILESDKPKVLPEAIRVAVETLEMSGQIEAANVLRSQYIPSARESIERRTYHYLPYSFDSGLEKSYYSRILRSLLESDDKLEAYFNGDDSLTDFYIECFKFDGKFWKNIGKYYPDFIVLKRDDAGRILRVILVETKGSIFENAFKDKKDFMKDFVDINNEQGTTKFEFLYIPESMPENERYQYTEQKISNFLNS